MHVQLLLPFEFLANCLLIFRLGQHMELRQGDLSALGWKTKKVAVTAGR